MQGHSRHRGPAAPQDCFISCSPPVAPLGVTGVVSFLSSYREVADGHDDDLQICMVQMSERVSGKPAQQTAHRRLLKDVLIPYLVYAIFKVSLSAFICTNGDWERSGTHPAPKCPLLALNWAAGKSVLNSGRTAHSPRAFLTQIEQE